MTSDTRATGELFRAAGVAETQLVLQFAQRHHTCVDCDCLVPPPPALHITAHLHTARVAAPLPPVLHHTLRAQHQRPFDPVKDNTSSLRLI
jgi:hypothetical protein